MTDKNKRKWANNEFYWNSNSLFDHLGSFLSVILTSYPYIYEKHTGIWFVNFSFFITFYNV